MSYTLNNMEVQTDMNFSDGISTCYCIRISFRDELDLEVIKYIGYTLANNAPAETVAVSLIELGNSIKRSLTNG